MFLIRSKGAPMRIRDGNTLADPMRAIGAAFVLFDRLPKGMAIGDSKDVEVVVVADTAEAERVQAQRASFVANAAAMISDYAAKVRARIDRMAGRAAPAAPLAPAPGPVAAHPPSESAPDPAPVAEPAPAPGPAPAHEKPKAKRRGWPRKGN